LNTNFTVLDSFIDSIAILNKSGDIIYTNKAWKTFSKENSGNFEKTDCNNNYINLCRKVTGEEFQNANEAANGIQMTIQREIQTFEMEYPCHSKTEQRWFILRATPLSNNSDLTITSHINVTKRKLAEETVEDKNRQLTMINERLNATIYKISHDIQGPLASIEGLVNITKTEEDSKHIKSFFIILEKSISSLKNYIQSTLNMSSSKNDPINFKALIDDYLEFIKFNEALSFINIETEIIQNDDFYSDKIEVASVISNIINNSIKYYDNKKTTKNIFISIKTSKTEAIISIKDNGIGIDKDLISKIFELNFQVNKNSNYGSGIGLHMVRKSIEFLNGHITVDSILGIGTETIITIPNLKQTTN
jgi:signal transduction histidine kinase